MTLLAFAGHAADEDGPPASLRGRLALPVELDTIPHQSIEPFAFDRETLAGLAEEAAAMRLGDDWVEAIAATSIGFGVNSMRAPCWTVIVAQVLAAFDGLDQPDQEILAEACALVLTPRATRLPAPPENEEAEETSEPQALEPEEQNQKGKVGELKDKLIETVKAELPDDLLASLAAAADRQPRALTGAAGNWQKPAKRGRRIGLRRGDLRRDKGLDLVATLTRAAPWQNWRRRMANPQRQKLPLLVESADLRFKRFKERRGSLMIFLVDASGSAAINRLGEAKGAVETILARCYVRRDEAALITFRQQDAALLLPPTRSLTRAKRLLAGLPGGGGTPLASALRAGFELATKSQRRGQSPFLILLSDGRGNIDLQGQANRNQAREDAGLWASQLGGLGIQSLVIDTSSRRQQSRMTPGPEIAKRMGGRYLVMPMADGQALARSIEAEIGDG